MPQQLVTDRLTSSFARSTKAVALALLIGVGVWSCVGEGDPETVRCPSSVVFGQHVSPYLERRCGTLDCHGQPTRPLRIYGQLGLRHPSEMNVSGGAATTQTELDANYAAVCNLQPEAMQEVMETFGASADQLLLVKKIRGEEGHKGGVVVDPQDPGDRCILNWLKARGADEVTTSCQTAVDQLK